MERILSELPPLPTHTFMVHLKDTYSFWGSPLPFPKRFPKFWVLIYEGDMDQSDNILTGILCTINYAEDCISRPSPSYIYILEVVSYQAGHTLWFLFSCLVPSWFLFLLLFLLFCNFSTFCSLLTVITFNRK